MRTTLRIIIKEYGKEQAMKINKWIPVVSAINLALLGLAIYVLGLYQHRTSIVESQTQITDFSVLEVNYRKLGSSIKIAYNGKEYYTAIPIPYSKRKTMNVEKLAYYYDAKNDAIFWESGLNKRHVVFFHSVFIFIATLDISRSSERRQAMKRILSDYLEIYNKFRTKGLSKLERKQRHTLLSEYEKQSMTMSL